MFPAGITAIVDTTSDSEEGGSLRAAIETIDYEGSTTSPNTILFQIPTSDFGYDPTTGTFTIYPGVNLPAVTVPVVIDGTSESAFLGQPAQIVINGSESPYPTDGLTLGAGSDGSTIDEIEIVQFTGSGIVVESTDNTIGGLTAGMGNILGSNTVAGVSFAQSNPFNGNSGVTGGVSVGTGNVVVGNYLGTDASGDNLGNSVGVYDAIGGNTIGGASAGAGNVIGFNTSAGVSLSGKVDLGDVVLGNFIGTNSIGANLGNQVGLFDSIGGNTIGGASAGAGNVIGFNTSAGVSISGQITSGDLLLGNFIGTNSAGANLGNPIGISDTVGGNTIGGANAGDGNVIGFNTATGVSISDQSGDLVLGNFIGTNTFGANLGNAIGLLDGTGNNTIGGVVAGSGNVIGDNTSVGISISAGSAPAGRITAAVGSAAGDLVLGNLIGTNAGGINLGNRVGLLDNSGNNTIGGTAVGAGNVIGFSAGAGASISGAATAGDLVLGNFIGSNAAGMNQGNATGLIVADSHNTIGGVVFEAGNLFGSNATAGIAFVGPSGSGNLVLGNEIGTNTAGDDVGNAVGILDGIGNNTIGGTAAFAGNVIGFNTAAGVSIGGEAGRGDLFVGNFVGTNALGARLPNSNGIAIASDGNTIGGTTAAAANVIGFNTGAGIQFFSARAVRDLIVGNRIGIDAGGSTALGNNIGILVSAGGSSTIGGTTAGSANVISGNQTAGIEIDGNGVNGVVIAGNQIGTNAAGTIAKSNDIGILVNEGGGSTIGGTTAGSANVISGNLTAGIELNGNGVSGVLIAGNEIGTDATGTTAVVQPDQTDPLEYLQNAGIAVIGSVGNTIGGTGAGSRNLISGNYVGVMLASSTKGSRPNLLLGNWIGTDSTGQQGLGNIVGVYINGSSDNQVGGTENGSGNVISGNTSVGVEIYGSGSTANVIDGNIIGLTANGTQAVGNSNGSFTQSEGIFIQDASGNSIGGKSAGAGNFITGNQSAGVFIFSQSGVSRANVVEGNAIGLTPSGGALPGNNGYGVLLVNSPNNQVRRRPHGANRYGHNRIANFRIAFSLEQASASNTHLPRAKAHPAGPSRHRTRG
jgi:hypothetical protein